MFTHNEHRGLKYTFDIKTYSLCDFYEFIINFITEPREFKYLVNSKKLILRDKLNKLNVITEHRTETEYYYNVIKDCITNNKINYAISAFRPISRLIIYIICDICDVKKNKENNI